MPLRVYNSLGRKKEEFEPLKNAEGANSPATVRQAMSNLFAEWLNRAEIEVRYRPDDSAAVPIEISPLFALDPEQLQARLARHGPVHEPLLLEEGSQFVLHPSAPLHEHSCREPAPL